MSKVRFLLDGEIVEVGDFDPTLTVLEWLRYRAGRTGTKEGCAEGDCGACTVLVGELKPDGASEPVRGASSLQWRAVNACILFLPMLDGKAMVTVESLSRDGRLHPVQKAMVELHGSQCGFCTPGIVMSLYGRVVGAAGTVDVATKDVLAGNLCRCTGYGPILAAAEANPRVEQDQSQIVEALSSLRRTAPLMLDFTDPLAGLTRRWFTPRTSDELADLLLAHPEARIVAGATDVGLWVTKQHKILKDIIYIGGIADLAALDETPEGLRIGAGTRYADAFDALARLHPDLGELVRRIGAVQVRNSGTIGGNIANGSPIGDMPPALIALGARLILRRGDVRRVMPLEDYFIAYGQQDREASEFVEAIEVPRPEASDIVRIIKLSKRFDSDISAVCAAFALRVDKGVISRARVAFGGMAGTPRRAAACEAALTGAPWSQATIDGAAAALAQDYAPLSDARGSSNYRLTAAANALRRLWFEQTGQGGTVLDQESVDA